MLEVLPSDVLALLASFLLGYELFHLSHVNSHALRRLTPLFWANRIFSAASNRTNLKREYCRQATSFLFRSTPRRNEIESRNCSYASVCRSARDVFGSWGLPFTFDCWISLLPPLSHGSDSNYPPVYYGGIVLGAQSAAHNNNRHWAHYHQQFIHVDTQGNLYCSVLNNKCVVMPGLTPMKWYHVVLIFENGRQCVYVDGRLMRVDHGGLHLEWAYLSYLQVGTGYISGNSVGKPTLEFCNCYGFNGIIDEFRVWRYALSDAEISQLYCEKENALSTVTIDMTAVYSLRRDSARYGRVGTRMVRCSRPREKFCHIDSILTGTNALEIDSI